MSSPNRFQLPSLPASHEDWIQYVAAHPETPLQELVAPYKEYESQLRYIFAQEPEHPAVTQLNVVPLFNGSEQEVKIRARDLASETETDATCYIMPLPAKKRRPHGSPAVVQSLKEFQANFQLFSESSLIDIDWNNMVVAGSAVVTALMPVPDADNASKRTLRHYYHEKIAPASDVDIFLYGLTEEQAIEKITQIEERIRDSISTDVTCVRTKHAVTIVSQYPTRHVQIVLRLYRSISEILTGFDVDCSCAAYNGEQVFASPRALSAFMTQQNTIDLSRRSPSYENRLSKYARRGFEIYCPMLDRSRIDPTLFERSFGRINGLARLLVLEKLPNSKDREAYVDKRRKERGRPTINRPWYRKLAGNMKDEHDDEVAEWVETDAVSDYHTFTIPYGPKYHARKIERLLYAKDLLLNAEWNRPKDRETELHRHPAFIGCTRDIIGDCCGYCPEPVTPEDREIAETESRNYISGHLTFIKDDPGRQSIGSFNPLTEDDWTEMAYVGNTARLCQAIVEHDLEHVQDWLGQEGADPNRRDYTGRTPLHLAVMSSSATVAQCLINAGARITPRMFDGKTALHLAAMRGEARIVKAILIRSNANQQKAEEEAEARKTARAMEHVKQDDQTRQTVFHEDDSDANSASPSNEDDIDMLDDETEDVAATTEGSLIKIKKAQLQEHEALPEDDNTDDPDVLDINAIAWDAQVSALHLAVAKGHTEVVKILVSDFGADLLLPVKSILPLVLALQLSPNQAKDMTNTLVNLGASSSQADANKITALHYFAAHGADLLKTLCRADQPAAKRAVNHLAMAGSDWMPEPISILQSATQKRDDAAVQVLLELGASPQIDFATYMDSFKIRWSRLLNSTDYYQEKFRESTRQPILAAVDYDMPLIVPKFLNAGSDVNTLNEGAWYFMKHRSTMYGGSPQSLLDAVREKIGNLESFLQNQTGEVRTLHPPYGRSIPPTPLEEDAHYLGSYNPSSYAYWTLSHQLQTSKMHYQSHLEDYNKHIASGKIPDGMKEKAAALEVLMAEFKTLESEIIERGGQTFEELHPDFKQEKNYGQSYQPRPMDAQSYGPSLSFMLPDVTEERKAGYIRLFEAVWTADLATIKRLTLAVWGDSQSPLQIAVKDGQGFSPFSIAILRNHTDLAKAILEIARAQYVPEESPRNIKHSLQSLDEEDEMNTDDIQIYSEIVDDEFTVEHIGQVQDQVKSNFTPLDMLTWSCPVFLFLEDRCQSENSTPLFPRDLRIFTHMANGRRKSTGGRAPRKRLMDAAKGRTHEPQFQLVDENVSESKTPENLFQLAIFLDDSRLLQDLLAMGEYHTMHRLDLGFKEIPSKFFQFGTNDFLFAINLGRVQMVQEIIKRTGAGLPLDRLAKDSGIEVVEKPRYYTGLSVNGKKRADWANAGRDSQCESSHSQYSPLLRAARFASMDSVDWFLSDAAQRCYAEFANNHRDDGRIQTLEKTSGGVESSISKWLMLRSHLMLHCVILGESNDNSLQLLKHLCKNYPESLSHRTAEGVTPLQLAFSLLKTDMARTLIEVGADQTCRDSSGNNICHSLLEQKGGTCRLQLPQLHDLLSLIDPHLITSLFKERSTAAPGAATPLAKWMYEHIRPHYPDAYRDPMPDFVEKILEFSKGEDLNIVSGEGDTPIHAAVRYGAAAELSVMLEHRPDLLHRENSTGRTPLEMAEDAYLSQEVFDLPPPIYKSANGFYLGGRRRTPRQRDDATPILSLPPDRFVKQVESNQRGVLAVWKLCQSFVEKTRGQKRRLVPLVEAFEVAKRLASNSKQTVGAGGTD